MIKTFAYRAQVWVLVPNKCKNNSDSHDLHKKLGGKRIGCCTSAWCSKVVSLFRHGIRKYWEFWSEIQCRTLWRGVAPAGIWKPGSQSKSDIIQLSLWEFKGYIRKSPTPTYLVSFLTSKEGTVCLQIQQTKLKYFQNDQLLVASVLHYCPERRRTLSLGTVSTIIHNNSTRHAYFHPSYFENVQLPLDLLQRRQ